MAEIQKKEKTGAKFVRGSILFNHYPKALSGLTPRSLMGSKWWNDQKKNAIIENNYCCHACGVNVNDAPFHKRLEAFPIYELKGACLEYKSCAALCHLCYSAANFKTTSSLFQKGFIDESKFDKVYHWRNEMFFLYGAELQTIFPEFNWSEYFLKIEGQKYFSKFKNEKECDDFYLTNQQNEGVQNGN